MMTLLLISILTSLYAEPAFLSKTKEAISKTEKFKEIHHNVLSALPISSQQLSLLVGIYTLAGIKTLDMDKLYPLRYNGFGVHMMYGLTDKEFSGIITYYKEF
jgi:hypothetical protein